MVVLSFEPEIMRFIQSFSNAVIDFIFKIFTQFGGETVCIVIMAFIYWCVNKRMGEKVGFITLSAVAANNIFKDIFRFERPIGYEGIKTDPALAAELEVNNSPTGYKYSYSFPSGHSITASSMYSSLAKSLNKWWGYVVAAVLILGVGISRMYVGVHWPKDVAAGWLLGLVFSLVLYRLVGGKSGKRKIIVYGVVAAVIAAAGFIFAATDDTVKSLGSLVGFVAGVAFENKFVDFEIENVGWIRRTIRFVLGLALIIGIKVALKAVFPTGLIFGFIRYFIILFFGMGIYPLIFKKLKF